MLGLKELLTTPSAQLGKASRFVVFQIKLWSHCARLLKKNRSGQQAAALSYHTVFGIVPLAIVTLLIFQSFPRYRAVGDKMKDFIYGQLNLSAFKSPAEPIETEPTAQEPKPQVEPVKEKAPAETVKIPKSKALTDHIDGLVARFFAETNRGQIGLFSVLVVIWAALALLGTIEKSFNNVWHVVTGRNFLHRIISYWALLTLGPLLLGVGIYLVTQRASRLPGISQPMLSYGVAVVAFFLLYFVLPNTRVKASAAIWGALVAAIVWVAAKNIFGYCITELKLYHTVYGAMALVPMAIFWIYITWLIVMFGLQLTYTTQHLKTLDAAEIAAAKETEEHFIANDLTVINIVREIAAAFETDRSPVAPEDICGKLDLPAEFGEKILDHLVKSGLIVRTSHPAVGYFPARDPASVKLSDIAEATAAAGFAQSTTEWSPSQKQIIQAQRRLLARHNLKRTLNLEQDSPTPEPAKTRESVPSKETG
ncbi:MAG: YhjD/YihY/BrkB family envelope integrity protein [Planctomycetota bacterium]|jgi:YihY family inner membrane protein